MKKKITTAIQSKHKKFIELRDVTKEKILAKKKKVFTLEKKYLDSMGTGTDPLFKLGDEYEKAKFSFVCFCVRHRLSYAEIGEILDIHRQNIYKIYRYGLTGRLYLADRREILERDNNCCQICRKENQHDGSMHIHHIGNPRSKSPDNLITLCASCHRKFEAIEKAKKLSTGK